MPAAPHGTDTHAACEVALSCSTDHLGFGRYGVESYHGDPPRRIRGRGRPRVPMPGTARTLQRPLGVSVLGQHDRRRGHWLARGDGGRRCGTIHSILSTVFTFSTNGISRLRVRHDGGTNRHG